MVKKNKSDNESIDNDNDSDTNEKSNENLSDDYDDDSSEAETASKPSKKVPKRRPGAKSPTVAPRKKKNFEPESEQNDSFDVVLPTYLGNAATGVCNVMVEVDSEDATLLDYEGISGAIGRLQADDRSDLKGCQYHASILPGPTALVVGLAKGGQLRVEAITDEFATMVKTQDIMAKLNAVVEGEMDETFWHKEENVNSNRDKMDEKGQRNKVDEVAEKQMGTTKKRDARRSSSQNNKKRKTKMAK